MITVVPTRSDPSPLGSALGTRVGGPGRWLLQRDVQVTDVVERHQPRQAVRAHLNHADAAIRNAHVEPQGGGQGEHSAHQVADDVAVASGARHCGRRPASTTLHASSLRPRPVAARSLRMPVSTTTRTSVVERFLRYVTYDTQSAEGSPTYPSTAKQLVLLDRVAEELRAIGLNDAARDASGYVMATIPSTTRKPHVPVIGFIAHVDTSPEASGAAVKPIVHRNWQGQDLVLPDDPTAVLRQADCP